MCVSVRIEMDWLTWKGRKSRMKLVYGEERESTYLMQLLFQSYPTSDSFVNSCWLLTCVSIYSSWSVFYLPCPVKILEINLWKSAVNSCPGLIFFIRRENWDLPEAISLRRKEGEGGEKARTFVRLFSYLYFLYVEYLSVCLFSLSLVMLWWKPESIEEEEEEDRLRKLLLLLFLSIIILSSSFFLI